jgi:TatA/E family protein of Tat protein translocase
MLSLGVPEMFAIVVIALLLFGPKKLPELGRLLGKGLSEFRRAKSELTRTFEMHMRELEREAKLSELHSPKILPAVPDYSSHSYSYPYEDSRINGPAETAPVAEPVSLLPHDSEPATIEPHGPMDYAAPHEPPVESSLPVSGTVARSNGVQHVTERPVTEEEHRA